MTPQEFRTLYEYDAWANTRTLDACKALTQEQLTRGLGNSFGSVRDTLVHILGAQIVWIERLTGGAPVGLPAADGYPDLAAVRTKWAEIEPRLQAYVNGLTAADADRVLEYRNVKGTVFRDPIGNILQHLANHGSYHRGQVTTLLRQLGATPVNTDMIGFYRERAAAKSAS
jgi:uncharacterized damage-inducible protein DinB